MGKGTFGVLGILCVFIMGAIGQDRSAPSDVAVYDKILSFAMAVLSTANFWDKLGTYQARTATINVHASADRLYRKKDLMRRNIIVGQMTNSDLSHQAVEIEGTIQEWEQQLDKFTGEISKATNLNASDALDAIHRMSSQKAIDFLRLRNLDLAKPDDRDKATAILDASMCRLKKIEDASKCLLDSIDKKKLACDPTQLQKDDCGPRAANP